MSVLSLLFEGVLLLVTPGSDVAPHPHRGSSSNEVATSVGLLEEWLYQELQHSPMLKRTRMVAVVTEVSKTIE